jgi:peptidoglycan/xylan/chitin deacetylase (PgdA/CDA1 family)
MYHYIRVNPVATDRAGFALSVTPADFARQLRFLEERGYTTLTMSQVSDFVLTGTPLPQKSIALTFDDGYDDAFTVAKPALDRQGMTATFYVVTGFVNHPFYMTWGQIAALDRSGMEIGAHTVHHLGLPRLSGLQRWDELTLSRSTLEGMLNHPVVDFCYPGGEFDAASEIAVREAGYVSATTTAYGFASPGDDPLSIHRIRVWGGETIQQFARVLGERPPAETPTPTSTTRPHRRLVTATPEPTRAGIATATPSLPRAPRGTPTP